MPNIGTFTAELGKLDLEDNEALVAHAATWENLNPDLRGAPRVLVPLHVLETREKQYRASHGGRKLSKQEKKEGYFQVPYHSVYGCFRAKEV